MLVKRQRNWSSGTSLPGNGRRSSPLWGAGCGDPQKTKHRITMRSRNSDSGHIPERTETKAWTSIHAPMFAAASSQPGNNAAAPWRWTGEQNKAAHTMEFCPALERKEILTRPFSTRMKPEKHAQGNKPDTKGQILRNSTVHGSYLDSNIQETESRAATELEGAGSQFWSKGTVSVWNGDKVLEMGWWWFTAVQMCSVSLKAHSKMVNCKLRVFYLLAKQKSWIM